MEKVIVISKRPELRAVFKEELGSTYEVQFEASAEIGLEQFSKNRFEFTFIDVEQLKKLEPENKDPVKNALKKFFKSFPTAHIIILSDNENMRDAVKAVKAGAADYLNYPVQPIEIRLVTDKAEENTKQQEELELLRDQFWSPESSALLETKSSAMKEVFKKIKSVAPTKSSVLLTGETGVGKSVFAKLIHEHSTRKTRPFIPVHCGAIPETLVESELFGHEKGAFTNAIKRKLGRFELADTGTIFLDEIGTVSKQTQIKLLQVLQDSTFQRIGGESDITVDARLIAATNEDLKSQSESGDFRKDLFFRLNVFPIEIPPLRDRIEDTPVLVNHFLENLRAVHGKGIHGVNPNFVNALMNYEWPGNIRELENVIERAFILETSDELSLESLPLEITRNDDSTAVVPMSTARSLAEVREEAIENVERQYLKQLLLEKKGKINETAETAGVGVRQIHKLMTKYGIIKDEFKNSPTDPAH